MLTNLNNLEGEARLLATRLGKELYTVETVVNGMSKSVHLNGFHKYAVLLLGMKHITGEKLITFDRLGSAYGEQEVSSAQMIIRNVTVGFSYNAFNVLGNKFVVTYDDMDEYSRYNNNGRLRNVALTFAGWDAFGMFVAEFMMDPTSYVPGLARGAAAILENVATEDGSDVADMGRFAHILFDDE